MKKVIVIFIALFWFSAGVFSQEIKDGKNVKARKPLKESVIKSRPDRNFGQRLSAGGINIRGNMTFIANNILNREVPQTYRRSRGWNWAQDDCGNWYRLYTYTPTGTSYSANDSHPDADLYYFEGTDGCNEDIYRRLNTTQNGRINMQYVDIDDVDGISGNGTTFSSSKSTLALPTCSRVRNAFLYWAGVYEYETWENQETRSGNVNEIKFRLPGGNYSDITADDVFDNNDDGAYYCFKDVTTMVQGLSDPNGEYYVGNVRATTGDTLSNGLGGAGGWTLLIIYENENQSSKNISVFDGFVTVDGSNDVDVNYSGFTTIPTGPVRAEFIVGTLEGDAFITGDQFQIEDNTNTYVDLSNTVNPDDNFFNGSISRYDAHTTTRSPASTNTLGFDVDLFRIDNPSNSVIGNNANSADARFTTSGDVYWPFLNAMSVEIIEPKLRLVKTIDDGAGGDLSGVPVTLGSELWYNVSFQNVGTDNALNTELVDILPKNVDLIEADLILPAGITAADYTYEPPSAANSFRGVLRINVPDSMVQEGGAQYDIRFKVQVVATCADLRDVCSNVVENQAFANYDSDRGGTPRVINEPSFAGIDACNFGIVGTSNFLVDASGCSNERDEVLCGNSVILTAGAGFDTYTWTDASGTVIGNTQSITVTSTGTYTVNKIAPVGCIDATEVINVIPFNTDPNPLIPYADQMLTCPNDGSDLAEIYLCGVGSSRTINLPLDSSNGTTVRWFKLDETSCPDETTVGCANLDTSCTWNEIGTEFNRTFDEPGEYRVEILYSGRCPRTFYFNVFRATLNPDIIKEDLICGNSAQITINNVPAGYQYSLTGPNGFFVDFQDSNTFTVTEQGDYNLEIRVNNPSAASCTYTFPPINILSRDIDVDLIPTHMLCNGDRGEVRIQVNNVPGQYTYTLMQGTTTVGTQGPVNSNDVTFEVTAGGTYEVTVTTADCSITESVVVNQAPELTLTAVKTKDITCENGSSPGIITLTATGGTLDTVAGDVYTYAVWTDRGTDLYTTVSDIPSSAFFTSNTYNVTNGNDGTYRFVVVDTNGCFTISNPIDIIEEPELSFSHTSTNISCNSGADGSINVTINGSNQGYLVEYSIDGGTNWNTTGNFTNLAANTYTVDIRASKSTHQCTYQIPNIDITIPSALSTTANLTQDYTCTTTGEITFEVATGGTAPYTYGIDGVYSTDRVKTGLTEGNYTLTVQDANGCIAAVGDITIDPLVVLPAFSYNVDYNCDGSGNATITPTDASYTYTLNGTSQSSNVFNGLSVGDHVVTISAPRACPRDITISILDNQGLTGSIVGSTDGVCNGANNGTITIEAANFSGSSYEYSTDGGSSWSTAIDNPYRIVGLGSGTFNILIRDDVGGTTCQVDLGSVTLDEPTPLVLNTSITEPASCSGTTTGATITAVASGGTPPYTYSIDGTNWQSSGVFTDVAPGSYTVLVRDIRNCDECGCTADPFVNGGFEQPGGFTGFRQLPENEIPGWDTTATDNRIEIWRSGFLGVTPSEGQYFAELNATQVSTLYQEYCTRPGDVITWSLDHRGRSGTDVAVVKFGGDLATAAIQETMSDGTSGWGSYSGTYIVPAGQSTTIIAFEAVSAAGGNSVGNFIDNVNIVITQSCTPASITIDPPVTVLHTATETNCYDGSNGQIAVTATQGAGDYVFRIDGGPWITPTPATSTTHTFTGLTPATYTIEVQDGLGCISAPSTHTINDQLDASLVVRNITCTPGQVDITATGGDGNYVYQIVPTGATFTNTSTSSSLAVLTPGVYDVYVRDNGGNAGYCEYIQTITVEETLNPILGNAVINQPNCSGDQGSFSVNITEGLAPFTVTVTGATSGAITANSSTNNTREYTNLAEDTYTVTIVDANGCPGNTLTINIVAPNPLAGSATQTEAYTCLQEGQITFTAATGGTSPYSYGVNGSYSSNLVYNNLTDGTYVLTVRDANGCEISLPNIVIDPLPAEPSFTFGVTYNCDGTGNVSVTPVDASYTYTLGATTNNTGVFNDLAVGDHTVTVDYGSDCTVDVVVTVDAGQEFMGTVSNLVNATCNGGSDGGLTITASNFTGSFDYLIDDGSGGTWTTATSSPVIVNTLSAGTYTVQIRPDASSLAACTLNLGSHTITEPAAVVASGTITKEVTCNPATGATIDPSATGGNAPYEFELDGSGTFQTGSFTDVAAGVHTIIARDVNGCLSAAFSITVDPTTDPTHSVVVTDCYNGSNGQIVVTASGGSGTGYTYTIDNGGTWAPSGTFTGLVPGVTYEVQVRDSKGCVSSLSTHTINDQIGATVVTNRIDCNGGSIVVTGTGGDGSYEYSVVPSGNGTAYQTSGTFTFNPGDAGSYDISVRDGLGCVYTETVTLEETLNPVLANTVNQPNCSGETGDFNINITEGLAPYTVTVTGATSGAVTANSSTTNTREYTNLAEDTYTVTIVDANGCSGNTLTITIVAPNPLAASASQTQDYTCLQEGQITFIAATGGTSPYSYGVNGSYSSNLVYNNLTDGTYVLTVRDANGCEISLPNIVINPLPAEPSFTFGVTYNCDGTGNVSVTPVDASYTYTLGATTNNTGVFNDLAVGDHTVTVDYGSDCTTNVVVTVDAGQEFMGTVSNLVNATCNGGSDGGLTITASNFTGSFDYLIDDGSGGTWTTATSSPVIVNTLSAGTYTVQIRPDASSLAACTLNLGSHTITEPAAVVASGTITKEVTCNPATGATIDPSATGGNAPYEFELDGSGTFQTGSFTDVAAGVHTIIARDVNGCLSAAFSITVDPTTDPTHSVVVTDCYNGSNGQIVVTASGGSGTGYTYTIDNGGTWAPSGTFTGLVPGVTYEVQVRDSKGCVSSLSTHTINDQIGATVVTNRIDCNGGSIVVTGTGGDGSYEYSVVPSGNGTAYQTSGTFTFNPGDAGSYDISVRDGLGCVYTETVTLEETLNPVLANTVNQPNCSGETGDFNINITEGLAPYTVTVTGATSGAVTANSSTTNTREYTNLAEDTYTVTIVDANGCSGNTLTITIVAPNPLAASASQTQDYTCLQEGQITFIAATGGTSPYSYGVNGSYSSNLVYNNLTDGTYVLTVRDANGCEISLPNIVINPLPAEPSFTFGVTYNCDGTGNVSVTPVDASYTYTLGATTNNTGVFNDLAVGDHTVTVDYGSDCTTNVVVTVDAGQEFMGTVSNLVNATCNGGSDGGLTITASNFTGSFDYLIDDGSGGTWTTATSSPVIVNTLSAGTYTVQIRPDASSLAACTLNLGSHTITEPAAVVASGTITKEVTCNPATGATIDPSATGGNAPYEFELDGSGTFQTGSFTDVAAGVHTIIARDVNGCLSAAFSITVDPTTDPTHSVVVTDCYNGSNGQIVVTASGGSGTGYTYTIDNGGTWAPSGTFTGLVPGVTYEVQVRDSKGCVSSLSTHTINDQIGATVVTNRIDCNGGSIVVTGTGGDGSYEYSVVPSGNGTAYQTSGTFTFNPGDAGSYDISVRDGLGCVYTETVTLEETLNPVLANTVNQPNCSGETGDFNINITEGLAPYTVTVTGATSGAVTANSSTTNTREYTNLAEDTYTVTIVDANGCSGNTLTITIVAPNPLAASASQTQDYTCLQEGQITFIAATGGTSPYSYGVNGSYSSNLVYNNLTDGTYVLTVRDANGCEISLPNIVINPLPAEPSFTFGVTYNCDGTGNVSVTPVDASYTYTLGATTNNTGVFNDLAVGDHTVTVDYGSDCTTNVVVTVDAGQEFMGTVSNLVNATCNGGSDGGLTITASNFTGSFDYLIDDGSGGTWTTATSSPVIVNTLSAGTYTVQIRPDASSLAACTLNLGSHTITEPAAVVASGTITKEVTCNPATGATIDPSATGGTAPYTYSLDGGAFQNGPFTDVAAGSHNIVAQDTNGCLSVAFNITVNAPTTPTFTATPTACFDGTNGQIVVTAASGDGNYQFILNGGAPQTPGTATHTFTGLGAGTYTIDITDGKGCTAVQQSVTINDELTADIDIIDANCNDGIITIAGIGGDGNYVYAAVTTGNPVTAGDFGASPITRAAGTYDVYVRDNNGAGVLGTDFCEYSQTVTVNQITAVNIVLTTAQPICNGDTGTIDVAISNGLQPHDLTLTGPVNQTVNDYVGANYSFTNLPAGTYSVTITDDSGCPFTPADVTLTDPIALVIDIQDVPPPDCDAVDITQTGFNFININPADYLPLILQHSVDNGATWTDFTDDNGQVRGYAPGTILNPVIRLSDSTGGVGNTICLLSHGQYMVPFNVEGLIVDVQVGGDCVAGYSITVRAIGGQGPFEFSNSTSTGPWFPAIQGGPVDLDPTNPNSDFRTHIFTNIIPGVNYQFYVRDTFDGCIELNNTPLVYPPSDFDVDITGTATSLSCSGVASDGAIGFTITDTDGVLAGNTINWELFDGNTNASLTTPVTGTIPSTTTYPHNLSVTGLEPGLYYIVLTSGSGATACDWGSGDIEIQEALPVTGNLTKLSDITCSNPGTIRVDNLTGGLAPYSYTVTTTNTTSGTATISGNTISVPYADLVDVTLSVDVTVNVSDSNGNACTLILGPETLSVSQEPVLEVADVTTDTCGADKSIIITTSNGGQAIGGTAPYQYSIDGGTTYSSPTASITHTESGLSPGNYNVIIRDANGCTSATVPVTIYEELDFNLAIQQNLNCVPGESLIRININSGVNLGTTGNYSYTINGVAPTADPATTVGTITGTDTFTDHTVTANGTYEVVVTDVTSGCNITRQITVEPAITPVFTASAIDNGNCSGSNE
ncbi:beta strand repeat-containing protein, partial [Tenacibaculum vairaonense]|uniref:beta strand repeat-containing protein n=1 Tax=Tenacibaculum vairaonense TaxID=3137860 RepID=UPI00399D70DF